MRTAFKNCLKQIRGFARKVSFDVSINFDGVAIGVYCSGGSNNIIIGLSILFVHIQCYIEKTKKGVIWKLLYLKESQDMLSQSGATEREWENQQKSGR